MSLQRHQAAGLHYPFDSVPSLRDSRPVCDGVQWLRLPLPFALNHVNCWLLGQGDDQVLVDTGIGRAESRDHWQWLFGQGRQGRLNAAPRTLLITHFHPDHAGLAGWFADSGSQLLGSTIEVSMARSLRAMDDERFARHYADWYAQNGLPQAWIDRVYQAPNTYRRAVEPLPDDEDWRFLQENEQITLAGEDYTVLTGRGHSPDMLMLFRERDHVLIAADQVLPGISPNVSAMPHLPEKSPLQRFLDTLCNLRRLPGDTLVLPSHGQPFHGLHARIAELELHHEQRLDEVRRACSSPRSAYELFEMLFRRQLDAQQISFALGESLAHLYHLEQLGVVKREVHGGVTRFGVTR